MNPGWLALLLHYTHLDIALDDTKARIDIHYFMHPECRDGDSLTDADAILEWVDKTVVGVLKPVIEV